WRIFYSVVQKVDQHALDGHGVDLDKREVGWQVGSHGVVCKPWRQPGKCGPDNLAKSMPVFVEAHTLALHPCEVEQVGDEPLQLLRLRADGTRELVMLKARSRLALEGFARPRMAVKGVLTSCEMAASNALRSRSPSMRRSVSWATPTKCI